MNNGPNAFIIIVALSICLIAAGCSVKETVNPPPPEGWYAGIIEEMALIPAGEFLFTGQIKTRVNSFYLDKTPVTNKQFV